MSNLLRRPVLYLLAFIIFFALISLGIWQLNRAANKKLLHLQWTQRSYVTLTKKDLQNPQRDLRYYQIKLTGKFDNAHTLLIDNKIVNHRLGYYIMTPFVIFGSDKLLLINRGWIPRTIVPHTLPIIEPRLGEQTITGTLVPIETKGLQLKEDIFTGQWPWVVQQLPLADLSKLLHKSFYAYQVNLNGALLSSQNLRVEKHIAYAFQWFALAATFLVGCVILVVKRRKEK